MPMLTSLLAAVVWALALLLPAQAATDARSAELLAAQARAMAPLAIYDGIWRGTATVTQPDGKLLQLTQTERVGSMLGGTIRVIEGRGYLPDGTVVFNAFAAISFSPQSGRYNFRSYAQGYSGDFPMQVRDDGFTWSMPAGPGVTLRYTGTVRDGVWTEVGERIVEGQPPARTFEMTLKRIGTTDWPAGGAVLPQGQPAKVPALSNTPALPGPNLVPTEVYDAAVPMTPENDALTAPQRWVEQGIAPAQFDVRISVQPAGISPIG